MSDTIFAPATPPGRGGVSVIRVSGPDAFEACSRLLKVPTVARFGLAKIRDLKGRVLDEALILSFAEGASFTGEKTVEIQCHGSLAVVDAVCSALRSVGLRDADAGEFTRRALENGQLSLVEVEALADLIDAETALQHRQAILAFGGGLNAVVEGWRTDLIRAIALTEATIDFADEDVPVDVFPEVVELLMSAQASMTSVLDRSSVAERVRSGSKVAIIGYPNVGKSTLLNAIAGSDVAITSDIPGTTRDVVAVRVNLDGLLVEFGDTAGVRDTIDPVEAIGVDRARKYAADADLRVFLVDERGVVDPLLEIDGDIRVSAKGDIALGPDSVSGLTGQGISELLANIGEKLKVKSVDDVVLIRDRQRTALRSCLLSIEASLGLLKSDLCGVEMIVDEVYQARRALDFLLGRLDVETVLGEIFSSFCIGK